MGAAVLTISNKNYSSWAMRGWLLCKMAGLEFTEKVLPIDDPSMRAEILHLSPSFLVPCLEHDGARVWDSLAIAEYLNEVKPDAGLLPNDRVARAHCRSVSGEMHGGFHNLRSAMPMNLKARHPGFKMWEAAKRDSERVIEIWKECLDRYGGPFLFGPKPTVADAMFAPVCTRFRTYDVKLDAQSAGYGRTVLAWAPVVEWIKGAEAEPDDVEELDMEF